MRFHRLFERRRQLEFERRHRERQARLTIELTKYHSVIASENRAEDFLDDARLREPDAVADFMFRGALRNFGEPRLVSLDSRYHLLCS